MTTSLPSFLEEHISQMPALALLINLGYEYLPAPEALVERKGKRTNVLLENILEKQLRRLNRIRFKGEHEFSDANIQAAIQALKDVPLDGLVRTSEKLYDLLALGKSFEQTIAGETKSFTLRYIDWERWENNVFHVVEEFEVERTASHQTCRPDIVLFVNGIPFAVIECKRPDLKDALQEAISQHIRNQNEDYIPRLFAFAQLLLGVSKNEAAYATTDTKAKFWQQWKEERDISDDVSHMVNRRLPRVQKARLFADRFAYVKEQFDEVEAEGRLITEQDRAIYSLCRPERLLELAYQFIVFDGNEKKIARYQQYFAVKNTLAKIKRADDEGRRTGGVIWHTQGSGKSLTMVMLAKAIALDREIANPQIVLVTDRIDLDDQIYNTFRQCGKELAQARSGEHLLKLLAGKKETIITTLVHKFKAATRKQQFSDRSPNLFVLVDEGHRTQYGEASAQMRKALPNACYVAFTGTPLMKREKITARTFGGIIDPPYTIDRAVEDKAVVPLLYEGRHILQQVEKKAIDKWFDVVTRPLNDAQKADLKRKFATADQLNKAHGKIYMIAYDISEHFAQNWKSTPFKGQLVADSKTSALKFKEYLDEFGQVASAVLISGPDTREGNEETDQVGKQEEQAFWKRMMDKYGNETNYNKQVINAFKHNDAPEIIIVVDKLLTGFDAPRNTVLYLARNLREHALLQAIARVNRLFEGKDFGYIIDYYGVLAELGEAMELYTSMPEFDAEDLAGTLEDISDEIRKLPQKHSELWDIFKTVSGKRDEEAFEQHLADEAVRQQFYERLSAYSRTLGIALSTVRFLVETPEEKITRYKDDLAFFQKLRYSVKKRYADGIDYREFEPKIQKLINAHVTSTEVLQITPQVNIFERDKFQAEIDKLQTAASKADTIAHRTQKTITEKMEEDPFFYRKFSKILKEVIEAYRQQRIDDAEYLNRVTEIMNSVRDRTGDDLPDELRHQDAAKAFYGVVQDVFGRLQQTPANAKMVAASVALEIEAIIQKNVVRDWAANLDVQNAMRNQIDDCLYALKAAKQIALNPDDMDFIIENAIRIAKTRVA
jgi:type I restriction enzyme, R subunit